MINIFSRKILIVHFIIILLFFSCKNNQSNISISSPKDCFADSVVLGNINTDCRVWLKQNEKDFELLKGEILYRYNSKTKTFDSIVNLFGKQTDDVFKVADDYYFDRRNRPNNLIRVFRDSMQYVPLPSSLYSLDGKQYILQLHSYNTFVKLADNKFIAPALYINDSNASDVSGYLNKHNHDMLGIFKIENNNKVVLKELINPYPRKNFILNEKRCLSISLSMCQSNNNFFVVPNFLDTIFRYNFKGDLIESIKLPDAIEFMYYNNEKIDTLNSKSFAHSEITGFKNLLLQYNQSENHLILITLVGLDQSKDYTVTPSLDEMDWFVSVYDLNKHEWTKVIRFTRDQDIRNLIFAHKNILVKRNNSKRLIFDEYVY